MEYKPHDHNNFSYKYWGKCKFHPQVFKVYYYSQQLKLLLAWLWNTKNQTRLYTKLFRHFFPGKNDYFIQKQCVNLTLCAFKYHCQKRKTKKKNTNPKPNWSKTKGLEWATFFLSTEYSFLSFFLFQSNGRKLVVTWCNFSIARDCTALTQKQWKVWSMYILFSTKSEKWQRFSVCIGNLNTRNWGRLLIKVTLFKGSTLCYLLFS